jgi:hypothetical protein
MTIKIFTVIVRNRLDSLSEVFKSLDNGRADLIRRLAFNLGHHWIAAFSFNQRNDGMLVGSAINSVAFLLTNADATLNRFWPKRNGMTIRELASLIMTARIAFTSLFLVVQIAR